MATPRLKNTLSIVGLAASASVTLTHGLADASKALEPDVIFLPSEKLEVTASGDTSITVRNNGTTSISGIVLVEAWHTIERAFGGAQNVNLTTKPYVVYSDAGDAAAAIRNPMALPEQWLVEALAPDTNGTMAQQVSKNFQGFQMLRAGSLVGMRVRPAATVAAGGAVFVPHINGLPVLGLVAILDFGSSPDGASGTAAVGLIPYEEGDIVTIVYTSTAEWDPVGDVEAWLEVYETL